MSATVRPASSVRRLSHLIMVVCGKALAQGALLACNVIVAWRAGPAEFGLYAAALNLVLILDACLGGPLDYTVIRFAAMGGDKVRAEEVQALAFRAKLAMASVLALVVWAIGPTMARALLHDPARLPLLWAVIAAFAGLLLARSTATFLQTQARFRDYATLDGLSGAFRIAAVGGAALLGVTAAVGFVSAFVLAYAVLIGGALLLLRQPYLTARLPDWAGRRAMMRFLGATSISIALGTISGRSDLLFLASATSSDVVASYAAAAQLASVVTMLAGYASLVTQPLLIPALREGRASRLLQESIVVGGVIGIACWLGAAWSGNALPELLFGRAIGGGVSGRLFAILMAGTALDLVCMPVAMTYVLQVKPLAAVTSEIALTSLFVAAAGAIAFSGSASMAIAFAELATALRAMKTVVYVGLMMRDVSRLGHRAARPGEWPTGT